MWATATHVASTFMDMKNSTNSNLRVLLPFSANKITISNPNCLHESSVASSPTSYHGNILWYLITTDHLPTLIILSNTLFNCGRRYSMFLSANSRSNFNIVSSSCSSMVCSTVYGRYKTKQKVHRQTLQTKLQNDNMQEKMTDM